MVGIELENDAISTNIMYMLLGLPNHHHSWNRTVKWCNFIPISCICCQDYIIIIMVGIKLENGAENI
jgi:hypothetical protein